MRMNIFSMDSTFYRFISKVGELMTLNILFLLCCIPIITVGVSVTAMYSVLLKLVRKESGYLVKEFWQAFRENFRQSTIIWLVMVATGIILYFDVIFSNAIGGRIGGIFKIIFLFFGMIYFSLTSYVFALQSRFANTIWNTIKNAFWMAVGYLPFTVSVLVIESIPIFLILIKPSMFWYVLPIMGTFGFGLIGFVCAGIFNHIFQNYMSDVEEEH